MPIRGNLLRFSSLRFRSTLVVLVVLLPFVAYVAWDAHRDRLAAIDSALEDVKRTKENIVESQTQIVENTRALLDLIVRLPEVRQLDPTACSRTLASILAVQPQYANLAVLNSLGNVTCSAIPLTKPVNAADRAWFKRAVASRGFVVGDYQIGRISGKPTLGFALPTLGGEGRIVSVAFAAVDLAALTKTLRTEALPAGSVFSIIDRNGTVLAQSLDASEWIGRTVGETELFRAIQRHASLDSLDITGLDGRRRLYHVFEIKASPDSVAVYAAIGVPMEGIAHDIERQLARDLTVLVALGLILLTAGYVGGERLILRPICRLADFSRDLEAGNLDARSGIVHGTNEFGSLAASMDKMAETLSQNERMLQESRKLLRAVIDAVPGCINVKDLTGRYVLVNAYEAEYHCRETDCIVGQSIDDLYPEHVACRIREHEAAFVEAGSAFQLYEETYQDRHGQARSWLTSKSPLRDESGRITHVVTIDRDITDRKRAEDELRASEAKYRAVVEAQTEMVTRSAPDSVLTFVNPAYCRYYRKRPEELLGKRWLSHVHEDDWTAVERYMASITPENPTGSLQYRAVLANGETRWQEWSHTVFFNSDGRVVEYQSVGRDITDRKLAEDKLRESEERLRLFVESSAVVTYTRDLATCRYRYIAPQAEHMFGYPTTDWADEAFWLSVIHPEDRDHARCFNGQLRGEQLDYRIVAADGRTVWVRDIVKIGTDAAGRAVGYGIMIDVTDTKAYEEQLIHVQKMEAVGQLTGGLAHDFNNLLAVVIGNLDLLTGHLSGNPKAQELARFAQSAGLRGAEMTQKLLAFSRRQPLQASVTDLNCVVDALKDMLRQTLGEHIDLQVNLGPSLWPVLADRSQLESAILNLAINARDAMPQGGKLTIDADNTPIDDGAIDANALPGDYVRLAVSDTGVGMSAEVLRHAVEPFFTTKEAGKGTGLGLSMIYGFAKQSGGHLKIHSELGRGTSVRLFLPRSHEPGTAVADTSGLRNDARGNGEMILVVDDDLAVRQTVVEQLRELGYGALVAADGIAALNLLKTTPNIDLLFTDVVMPGGMSGWDLAQAARKIYPDVRCLFTSGFAQTSVRMAASVQIAKEALLTKPYRMQDLAKKIHEILYRSEQSRSKGRRSRAKRAG